MARNRDLRAAEVGKDPNAVTYELALKIRTVKNGPVIRNRVRLPYPVKNDTRIAVICNEANPAANEARSAGAVMVGEESLFEFIRENKGNLPFNRLLCHTSSEAALKKANLGRILGPKGLMPNSKTNTVVKSIGATMREMVGAEQYREKTGAIRMPIGNIQFTPKMLSLNVKALLASINGDIQRLEDRVAKTVIEVVLSSTSGPGLSLNGGFNPQDASVTPEHLSTAM
jgi:large subunit ribosomal protein L1